MDYKEEILMRKAKRYLALAAALASVFSLAACGGSDGSSGEEAITTRPGVELDSSKVDTINDAVADVDFGNTELANTEVTWLAHYDVNPNNGAVKDPALQLFEDKYNGKITWIQTSWNDRYTKLASLVSANTAPDMFPADDMDAFPIGAIKGMFQPFDQYVDFNNEYWKAVEENCNKFSLAGKKYVAVIYTQPNLICIYNKEVVADNGFDDPAELYEKGEWTWDAMRDMAISFTNADEDKYAFDGFWYWNGISQTSGVPFIGIEDGKVVNNLEDPKLQEVQDFIYDLCKAGVGFPRHLNDWSTRGSTDSGSEGMGKGLTLFIPVGFYEIEASLEETKDLGDISAGEVMFVPLPSKDGSDPYMPARVHGYCLCSGAPNPEGWAAFMYCQLVANSMDEVKAVGTSTLVDDYGWTQEMIDMREECYRLAQEKPVFEFYDSISVDLSTAFGTIAVATSNTSGDATTWATVVAENNNGVNYYVNEINAKIEDVVNKNS